MSCSQTCCTFAALVLLLCTCCKAQTSDFLLILSRPSGPIDRNNLNLLCRDMRTSLDRTDVGFWLNTMDNELRDVVDVDIANTGFRFVITRELEGIYFCGEENSLSDRVPIVAYPLINEFVSPQNFPFELGQDAVLSPLISPGALLQQYYIDWLDMTTMQVLASIQGPRAAIDIQNDRYSVDPDTFELKIKKITFADRGLYVGVVGVVDSSQFEYQQTRDNAVNLVVNVRPTFIVPPRAQVARAGSSTTFNCTVTAFPEPTINWYHDGKLVSDPLKYAVQLRSISSAMFIIESVVTISDLINEDIGSVTCEAMVQFEEGDPVISASTASLSVLGRVSVTTYITLRQEVFFRVTLSKEMDADLQLFILYTDTQNQLTNYTITYERYSRAMMITHFEPKVPLSQFRVQVALMHGSLKGPLSQLGPMQNIYSPTELNETLIRYLVPAISAVLGTLILATAVLIIFCICYRKQGLNCCFQVNSEATQARLLDKNFELREMKESLQELQEWRQFAKDRNIPPPALGPGGPPIPMTTRSKTSSWRPYCLRVTRKEKYAKQNLVHIQSLLRTAMVGNGAGSNDSLDRGENMSSSLKGFETSC